MFYPKGVWLKRENESTEPFPAIDWSFVEAFAPEFHLDESDFIFDDPIGIEMVNDVITKPYNVTIDITAIGLQMIMMKVSLCFSIEMENGMSIQLLKGSQQDVKALRPRIRIQEILS